MWTPDRNWLAREYSPTRTFCFVLFLFVLLLLMKTDSENKRKTWNQNTRGQHSTEGLPACRTGFFAVGWMGLRGSGPAPTCSVQGREAAFREAWITKFRAHGQRGQGKGWERRGLWRELCTDGRVAYSTDSEGGISSRDGDNKPEVRKGT